MTTEDNSKKKKTSWKLTDNRFVAFLDILGFKDLVMRSSHDDIYKLLNNISNIRNTIEKVNDIGDKPSILEDAEVYTVSFSDSIVLFSKNDSEENFNMFIHSVNWLFSKSIEKSIPLKGGIAHGEISINKSSQVYFGQPIIDAYLLEEEVNYFGVVAHNSIDSYIHKNNINNKRKWWFEDETPLKCGMINHINLNWFKLIKEDNKSSKDVVIGKINAFKITVSGSPRRYVDNTLKFFNKVNTEHNIV